jgi:hypothetical protein
LQTRSEEQRLSVVDRSLKPDPHRSMEGVRARPGFIGDLSTGDGEEPREKTAKKAEGNGKC